MTNIREDFLYMWPKGVMPYEIGGGFTNAERQTIVRAIRILNNSTNLTLKQRGEELDYIYFKRILPNDSSFLGAGSSKIGRQGGKQEISLKNPRLPMVVCH